MTYRSQLEADQVIIENLRREIRELKNSLKKKEKDNQPQLKDSHRNTIVNRNNDIFLRKEEINGINPFVSLFIIILISSLAKIFYFFF